MKKYITAIMILMVFLIVYTNADSFNIQAAIDTASIDSTVNIPPGVYQIDIPLKITKQVSLIGAGRSTRLISPGNNLIIVDGRAIPGGIQYITIANMKLESLKQTNSLLALYGVHDSTIEKLWLRGSEKAIYICGCLRNFIFNINVDTGYHGNGAPLPKYGIFLEADTAKHIGNNHNVLMVVNPRLCDIGIYARDGVGEGSFTLIGSASEGCKTAGIQVMGMTQPVNIKYVHDEASGAGIQLDSNRVINMEGIYETERIILKNSPNASISDSYISGIQGDAESMVSIAGVMIGSKKIEVGPKATLKNITYTDGSGSGPGSPSSTTAKNTVPGDLENWINGKVAGFEVYDKGKALQTPIVKFNTSAAVVESLGGNTGLSVVIDATKYKDLAGKKVCLSGYFRADKTIQGAIYVRYYGNVNYFTTQRFNADTEWKRFIYVFELDTRASSCRFIWGLYGQPTGARLYMDGLEAVIGDEASPIYDNSAD